MVTHTLQIADYIIRYLITLLIMLDAPSWDLITEQGHAEQIVIWSQTY